jgi:hypothetical protein
MAKIQKQKAELRKAEEHKRQLAEAKAKRRAGANLERAQSILEQKPSIFALL